MLAKQTFASSTQALEYLFRLACGCTGMAASFLLRNNLSSMSLDLVAGYSSAAAPWAIPLQARILLMEQPKIWTNWMEEPRFTAALQPITMPINGYATWVPIRLKSGVKFGIFVVADPAMKSISEAHRELLETMAYRMADEVDTQRDLQLQLESQHKFVAVVSHEFRTALTSILGYSQMLRDDIYPVAEVQDFAGDMFEDSNRLLRLITDMLDLDRMAVGRMPLHCQPTQLNTLIEQSVAHLTRSNPTAMLQLDLSPSLPVIMADADKLVQIVTNLLNNALKYAPSESRISVGTDWKDNQVHCWVRDQGAGIAPQALETIFEPFSRIEDSASRHIGGTGLGLPIVREIARLHGGNAWAESKPGHGATFHVTLAIDSE